MSSVKFTCTSLVGTEKKGVLTPDANGYYTLPIGGLNVINSAGEYYDYQGAKALFEQSSTFMRRVKRGALRAENGHPKFQSGMTEDDYIARILTIDEDNVCGHFSEINLDFDNFKESNGSKIIGIVGKVAPSGKLSYILEKALNNPKENVCFSIRAFTEDSRGLNNLRTRTLRTIVTFDYVNEPGIHIAEKFKSPALESLTDRVVTRRTLERATVRNPNGIATESMALSAEELFQSLGWSVSKQDRPIFEKW